LHRATSNAVLSINETANFESDLLIGTSSFSLRTTNSNEEMELYLTGFHQHYITPYHYCFHRRKVSYHFHIFWAVLRDILA